MVNGWVVNGLVVNGLVVNGLVVNGFAKVWCAIKTSAKSLLFWAENKIRDLTGFFFFFLSSNNIRFFMFVYVMVKFTLYLTVTDKFHFLLSQV